MSDIRAYAGVTAAYWAFTLTDGALRMLVLLHFHRLGYSPLDLAFLFLLYEFFGIVTNAAGGWIGARLGLRITLFSGLAIQVAALVMLSGLDPNWPGALAILWVMAAQALSGIAKDLTKMSSKSAVKLVVADGAGGASGDGSEGTLFRWVAMLTGSKNALKGVGFFLGGLLLEVLGFQGALWAMAAMLALVLGTALVTLKSDMGKAKSKLSGRDLFSKARSINVLSAARVFLFAARDVWFVVALPLFLTSVLGWGFAQVGGFMAAWVIGYGMVQAVAPRLLGGKGDAISGARAAQIWGFALAAIPAAMAVGLTQDLPAEWLVLGGLALFGIAFAVNSSVHSYLILAYSDADKVALDVGFYYMANAAGRLAGTLLSGLLYQWGGLVACLAASAILVAVAASAVLALPSRHESPST